MTIRQFVSFSVPHPGVLVPVASALLLVVLLSGCSKDYETVPVSGRVTLDGQPVANVGLTFVPLAENKEKVNIGPGSLGKTDEEGRFTLRTVQGDKGAVPTDHIVRMELAVSGGGAGSGDELAAPDRTPTKLRLPRSAQDGSLHYQVPPEGTDQADFDLTSDPKKRSR